MEDGAWHVRIDGDYFNKVLGTVRVAGETETLTSWTNSTGQYGKDAYTTCNLYSRNQSYLVGSCVWLW